MRRWRKSRRKAARKTGNHLNFETRDEAKEKDGGANLDGRSLKTGLLITLIAGLYLAAAQQTGWAMGFVCGSALSLFSLFSLKSMISLLFRPGGMPFKTFFMLLALFIKLPAYCIVLDFALNTRGLSHGAVVAGLCLTPAVITLKTIGQALLANVPATAEPAAKTTVTARIANRRRAVRLARERG